MTYRRLLSITVVVVVILSILMAVLTGCFGNANTDNRTTSDPKTDDQIVKPKPVVQWVKATTSGTRDAYYATLDIRVKNEGAEGIILVVASVTQAGKTSQSEMPVYLKQGVSHELKMTFPLVWRGGDFSSSVEAVLP